VTTDFDGTSLGLETLIPPQYLLAEGKFCCSVLVGRCDQRAVGEKCRYRILGKHAVAAGAGRWGPMPENLEAQEHVRMIFLSF
jgi:hypothetical protein